MGANNLSLLFGSLTIHFFLAITGMVLTRGKRGCPNNDVGDQLNEERKRMQSDLLNLERNSKQIVAANSGHHIQLDEPEVVTSAIQQVVEAVRRGAKLSN
jgi:hypothetical protein